MSNITRKKLAKGTKLPAQSLNNFYSDITNQINTPTIDRDNLPYRSNFDLTFNTRVLKNNTTLGKGWTAYGDMNTTTGVITLMAGDMGSPITNPTPTTEGYTDQYIYQNFHFILPNTQEVFNATGLKTDSYVYSLNRVVVSVDTLDNPAGTHPTVTDAAYTPVGTYHSIAATDAMDITVSLHRKTPFKNSSTTFWEEKVGSWNIPSAAFLNAGLDTNPFSFEDLKIKMFPDAVYLLAITTNNTTQTLQIDYATTEPQAFIINNLQINLGFSCELLNYDVLTFTTEKPSLQNTPYSDQFGSWTLSNTVTSTVAITGGDEIKEENVQANMSSIDVPVVRKLVGGYETDSSMPHHQQIKTSACYEVKQVPLFNNNNMMFDWQKKKKNAVDPYQLFAVKPGFTGTACNIFPYSTLIPTPVNWKNYETQVNYLQVADRKFFPIHEPFMIHHLFFTYWVGDPTQTTGLRPENANTYFELSVFLHTLNRSDSVIRHRIAYAKWQPVTGVDRVTGNNLLVDKALWLEQQNSPLFKNNPSVLPCGFTIQIPTNYGALGTEQGSGYCTTGKPLFFGRGNYPYSAYGSRTQIYKDIANSTRVNYTQGHEQYLEVVFKIGNPDGIGCNVFTRSGEAGPADPNYTVSWAETGTKLQQPGAMLYMIGKKSLVDSRGNH